jgi:hypothetical protein
MYAAMHKISTQLLQCTRCRIKGLEQVVVVAVALSRWANLMEAQCLETGCD